MSKVILVDNSSIVHQSIFSWNAQKKRQIETKNETGFILPSSYSYFMSLISLLKRVGVNEDDTVILAGDGRNSWRKAFLKEYKGQRKDFRESHDLIDWNYHYSKINQTVTAINNSTNFHIIWLSGIFTFLDLLNTPEGQNFLTENDFDDLMLEFGLEADDIIATACETFQDKDCIVITKDADMEQLCVRPNVRFFSMNLKWKGGTGVYKPVENGYKILEKKIRLGDKSDNIIIPENDTEINQQIRKLIIDLIHLPEWVKNPINMILMNLPNKKINYSLLPYQNSLAKRFPQIYENDKIITYEDSVKRLERQTMRAKKKKEKLKNESNFRKLKKEKVKK